jgi:hypothetical protein
MGKTKTEHRGPIQRYLLTGLELPEPADLDELYTPWEAFKPWHEEFRFTLDPCATQESAKVPRFFHKGQNGLAQSWEGERVFLNPPYSQLDAWTAKAVDEVIFNGCALVVGLYPANRSEQDFWQVHVEPWRDGKALHPRFSLETRFVDGRIAFDRPGRAYAPGAVRPRSTGKFPSVLLIWRAR